MLDNTLGQNPSFNNHGEMFQAEIIREMCTYSFLLGILYVWEPERFYGLDIMKETIPLP